MITASIVVAFFMGIMVGVVAKGDADRSQNSLYSNSANPGAYFSCKTDDSKSYELYVEPGADIEVPGHCRFMSTGNLHNLGR